MENKSIGNVALLGIFVTIVSAIGAVGSALYTRHISEATKEQLQIAREQIQVAKDIAADNLLEELGSGGPGNSCLMYLDALLKDDKKENFYHAVLEKNHFVMNVGIFDELQRCLGRQNIQLDEPSQYPYEIKGINAQKPADAAFTQLNLL